MDGRHGWVGVREGGGVKQADDPEGSVRTTVSIMTRHMSLLSEGEMGEDGGVTLTSLRSTIL